MEDHMPQANTIPNPQIRALTADETDAVTGGRLSASAAIKAIGEALATAARKG
jgi:hypothetical protein